MFTMRPRLWRRKTATASRVTKNVPWTLTSNTRFHSSVLTSVNGVGEEMPALLTTPTSCGSSASIRATASTTCVSSEMSTPRPRAGTP